jgi:hypothetical protein
VCSRYNTFRTFILPTLSQLAIIFSPEDNWRCLVDLLMALHTSKDMTTIQQKVASKL